MRAVLATALVLLAGAPAARAGTIDHAVPAVGPAFAGAQVAWGEEGRDRSLRVVRARPRQVVYRVAAATAPRTHRTFLHAPWAFGASSNAFAALVYTGTARSAGDAASVVIEPVAAGGPWDAPAVLSGTLAERGDGPCVSGRPAPVAVAVDAGTIAVAEIISNCDTAETAFRIVVRRGTQPTEVRPGGWVQSLGLTGTQLAWTTSAGERLTVRDLADGAPARRLGRRRLHGAIEDLDVAADGAVAFTIGSRLGYVAPGSRRVRVLDRRVADRDVALAGGRVLYERRRPRAGRRTELVVRRVAGGRARRLAGFRPGHRRVGDLDLDATRATWAVRAPRPRIVVTTL